MKKILKGISTKRVEVLALLYFNYLGITFGTGKLEYRLPNFEKKTEASRCLLFSFYLDTKIFFEWSSSPFLLNWFSENLLRLILCFSQSKKNIT